MVKLSEEIASFFHKQSFAIVTTVDKDGSPHNACKGIVQIEPAGKIYLLDLYRANTFGNLKQNPNISITAVDEHKFKGYCLKGKARIVDTEELDPKILKTWEDKITGRVASRLIRNLRGEKGHKKHPEIHLPKPAYMIVMEVEKTIDLTPHHLQEV
jgi:uncharacterized pyridoxamine 5'-phosphate oxidase family protein